MALTQENIVQMAAANIGSSEVVTNISTPTTKLEQLGALFYATVRDRILAAHNWSWATRRATLTDVTAAEITTPKRLGWAYAYTLPSDLVRFIDLDLGYRSGPAAATYDPNEPNQLGARWTLEMNTAGTGKVLLCDISGAVGVYTARITTLSLWDLDAIDALVWAMSFALAMPMAVKSEYAQLAERMASLSLLKAIADDANEAKPDPASTSEIITVRSW